MRMQSRGLVGECLCHAGCESLDKSHYHRQIVVQLIGSGQQCHLYREETGLGLGLSPVELLRGHQTSLSVDRSPTHTVSFPWGMTGSTRETSRWCHCISISQPDEHGKLYRRLSRNLKTKYALDLHGWGRHPSHLWLVLADDDVVSG